jgi:hypothetical protein
MSADSTASSITIADIPLSYAQRPNPVKMKVALFYLALCVLSAATRASGQQLYPVAGPVSSETPLRTIRAKLNGGPQSGGISLVFADGETFQGRWAYLRPSLVNAKPPEAPDSYPPQPSLNFAWDAIYGQGYFLAHLLGEPMGQAILTGNQKTILQLEFFNGKYGVAADSKGNIYKMVW